MEIREIINGVLREGRHYLLEYESEEILSLIGVPVAPGSLTVTLDEAIAAAGRIGYPVVMKVMSPGIIHKSDAGVVRVDIDDAGSLREAWEEITANARSYAPEAEIEGVFVQKMIFGDREVIIGASRDPQFGPVIMFGLGGVFVEVLKDVVFRVAPVPPDEAMRMIRDIRSLPILEGVRGAQPIDFTALAAAISRISHLMIDYPRISELDVNPLLVDEAGVIALDARIILSE